MKGITPEIREKFRETQIRLFGYGSFGSGSTNNNDSPETGEDSPDKSGDEDSGNEN